LERVTRIKEIDKQIDQAGRKLALDIAHLMSIVDYEYNRHEPCLVCNHKLKQHIDGLACESDDNRKQIVSVDKWKNIKYLTK
jgi:hypothetical protein